MVSRIMGSLLPAALLLAAVLAVCGPASAAIPDGVGRQTADLDGVALEIFTYRPEGCAVTGALLVFHGLERNAATYRDHAIPLGRKLCRLVVAPLFDKARFPTAAYQRGGIAYNGSVLPMGSWTVALIPQLVAWVRGAEGKPDLPAALIGHSAGGQFLSRVAAFMPNDATRMVVANPSSWVRASLDVAAPYGLGGVYPEAQREAALRRYLAAPVTVLLGQEDHGSKNLATSAEAEEQGGTRFERGETVFREAEMTARQHGWTFNWRLVEVPGVGHDARRIFASDQALVALQP